MTARLPDILVFLSDQHHGLYAGFAGHPLVETPHLDRLAADGTVCETVYTACPLCVPARSALLTGQLPSHNGVYDNSHILDSGRATFLDGLAVAGYQTVLCGRMHFKGVDQRHGFDRRIHGDITSGYLDGISRSEAYGSAFGMGGCIDLAGWGDSPVLTYDRAVAGAALDYLEQDHGKPQCIVVGTYGPHFPYVAPPEYAARYERRVAAPVSWDPEGRDENPLVDAKRQRTRHNRHTGEVEPVTTEIMLAARAAYFGMITEQDRLIGTVRDQWRRYLQRTGRPGVFVYTSDHGDTCGEHGIFGKQTFYEGSSRIPLVFAGAGIAAGRRLRQPASIMDVGPTLCDLVGTIAPPRQDGISLASSLQGNDEAPRSVLSEWVQWYDDRVVAGRMVRQDDWKLIRFNHAAIPDQLFDLSTDPDELENHAGESLEIVQDLGEQLEDGWDPGRITAEFGEKREHVKLLNRRHQIVPTAEAFTDVWRLPSEVNRLPERFI